MNRLVIIGNGFDKELAGSDIESLWKEMNMKTQDN